MHRPHGVYIIVQYVSILLSGDPPTMALLLLKLPKYYPTIQVSYSKKNVFTE